MSLWYTDEERLLPGSSETGPNCRSAMISLINSKTLRLGKINTYRIEFKTPGPLSLWLFSPKKASSVHM